MVRPDAGGTLREQREYYDARASEYDDAYRRTARYDRGEAVNAEWHAEMARLVSAFDAFPVAGDVVELAAGTGMWTERIVGRARSLTVIDGSAEMLAVNRRRLGSASEHVKYEVADLLEWSPRRAWDVCVFGFWLCHVPDDRVAAFLRTVAHSLRDGGMVCVIEKAATVDAASERVVRTLHDGREFTIIDHPRPPHTLVEVFADAGLAVAIETFGTRFCLGQGTKR